MAQLVGARIRELRQERGWVQIDLAEHLDGKPKQATLSTIETGQRFPSHRTLEKLIEAFRVEPASLFLSPKQNFRHRVALAVLECPEDILRYVAKLLETSPPPAEQSDQDKTPAEVITSTRSNVKEALTDLERRYHAEKGAIYRRALEAENWNLRRAAKALGIGISSIQNILSRYPDLESERQKRGPSSGRPKKKKR